LFRLRYGETCLSVLRIPSMTNSAYAKRLTISQAQQNQPWTVPYSEGVAFARAGYMLGNGSTPVPHILGSHCVLHAVKSLGKIAAVYEARDHDAAPLAEDSAQDTIRRLAIRAAAADLFTAALRFANLEGFDLAEALVERVQEKNGADFGCLPECPRCSGGGCR
jgi:hypothetical protein